MSLHGLVWAAVCLLATAGIAQEQPVPPGDARIVGRVVHSATGQPVADVDTILYALPESGQPGVQRTSSDADGNFSFEAISNSPRIGYLVGARYRDVPFAGARVSFEAGESEAKLDIRVSETRSDPGELAISEVVYRLEWRGRELIVAQEVRLLNPHDETLFVKAEGRDGAPPLLQLELPSGGRDVTFPFGVDPEGLVRGGNHLAYYGPIYPGEQPFRFGYSLASEDEVLSLELPIPLGAKRAVLLAPEAGPEPETLLLAEGVVTVGERKFRRYSAEIGSARTVAARFDLPQAVSDPSLIQISESQWVIDGDSAALTMREEYKIGVSGTDSVVAEPGGSLFRISLPAGAEEIRFGTGDAGIELRADPSGGLAVDGPLPPGDTTLSIQYRVPVTASPVRLARELSHDLNLLTVFVADDGRTLARSAELHRRRPLRTRDRNYIHLEAFALKSGATVTLDLEGQRARPRMARPLFFGALALGTLGVVFLLSSPLLGGGRALEKESEAPLDRERQALLASLRDLEHDFETGKISPEDHEELREALRYRAAKTYAEPEAPEAEATLDTGACVSCGTELPPLAQFCPQCGNRLSDPAATDASA